MALELGDQLRAGGDLEQLEHAGEGGRFVAASASAAPAARPSSAPSASLTIGPWWVIAHVEHARARRGP